jgi:site-specific recombinase XerD
LYTTGLRIREALSLNCDDYIPQEKLIHIRQGKFRKERYVILSHSMNKNLKSYLEKHKILFPSTSDSPLFIGMRKKRLIYNSVHARFRQLLKTLLNLSSKKYYPRIHDLRHTFAVHRLLQWYDSGEDINVKLPFLSTYMGHVKITSTQVYIHATKELLQKGSNRFHHFFFDNNKRRS